MTDAGGVSIVELGLTKKDLGLDTPKIEFPNSEILIENNLVDQLTNEFLRKRLLDLLGVRPPEKDISKGIEVIRQYFENPKFGSAIPGDSLSEEEGKKFQELKKSESEISNSALRQAIDGLKYRLRSEGFKKSSFQEVSNFVTMVSPPNGKEGLDFPMEESKIEEFVTDLNTDCWQVFKENQEVQKLLGKDRLKTANGFIGNQIMQRLIESEEHTDQSVNLGYKLLNFVNPETMPVIILNSYREPGHSGGYPFLGRKSHSDKSELFKAVNNLTGEDFRILKEKNIPGVIQVIELIKNNPKTFLDKEINKKIIESLNKIALNFLRGNDENKQFFVVSLLKNINFFNIDLKDDYGELERIFVSTKNQKLQETIFSCCLLRTKFADKNSIEVLLRSYDGADKTLQDKIQESAPELLTGMLGKKENDTSNLKTLSKILNKNPEEISKTIDFIKKVGYGYSPSYLDEYIKVANDSEMMLFIEKIKNYGYSFSPTDVGVLEDLFKKQDLIIGQIENIKKTFPDFTFRPRVLNDSSLGGIPRFLSDPYEILMAEKFSGIDGINKGINYLNEIPLEYKGNAVKALIHEINVGFSLAGPAMANRRAEEFIKEYKPDKEQLVKFLNNTFNLISSYDLGEIEIPIYESLVETAGLIYNEDSFFYDLEKIEGNVSIKRPKTFNEAMIFQIIAEGNQEKIYSCIYNFTDFYRYNLDDKFYEENIERAHSERDLAVKMLESISDPCLRGLATIKTFEYLLDPDLGNLEMANQLLSKITDTDLKKHLESIYKEESERSARGEKKYTELFKKVDMISSFNKEELIKSLGFSENTEREKLEEEVLKVKKTMHVSINISYRNLTRVLREGRFKSMWEARNDDLSYNVDRNRLEKEMGIKAKGTRSDPHPIYGAAWFENGRDEKRGGTRVDWYGKSFFILKNDRIKDRTTFTYGDSFAAGPKMLTWDEAIWAKAMMNIRGGDYVEAQILGGVTTDDIESINIPMENLNQDEIDKLKEEFPNIKFNILPIT